MVKHSETMHVLVSIYEFIPGNIAAKRRIKLMLCMVKHSETMHVLGQYECILGNIARRGRNNTHTSALHGEKVNPCPCDPHHRHEGHEVERN